MSRRGGGGVGPGTLLLILAVICFVLVAVGVDIGRLNLPAIGLALFAASFIFP
jgi:hypothetical protein